ncbi:unnamed protein product, partial [Protopolystoma xenopodis]
MWLTHNSQVHKICKPFWLENKDLEDILKIMDKEMTTSLNGDSKLRPKMLSTFIHNVPTVKETGKYLALDLGGTNYR